MDEVTKLALDISSCSEVSKALTDGSHPCHEVVDWQSKQWNPQVFQITNSQMHRPEAWTGDLENAPILFLSSNPSFDSEENYPNWNLEEWPIQNVGKFSTNRFTSDLKRGFGASDGLPSKDLDRTIGNDGKLLHKVKYWGWARNMAAYIHGKNPSQVSAHSDYAMSEIVHCKSVKEIGVRSARAKCKDKFLEKILKISNAELIIISGKHACEDIKALYPDNFSTSWGLWNADGGNSDGFWPMTTSRFPSEIATGRWSLEVQQKHSVTFEVAGRLRTFQYFAKSGGGGGLNAPWNYPDLVHPEILSNWRQLISR
jgi:hypothetical protein